jgi:hypothetical protein
MIDFDKFYSDFNFAQGVNEKRQILESFSDDISDDDLKELQCQINDVIENSKIEEDIIISMELEDGKYQLYTCIESVSDYKSGCNYYVKVDDPKEFYLNTGIAETNTVIKSMIDSIRPIYYIVVDDGIGTLKRKNILTKDVDFSNYFTKFA